MKKINGTWIEFHHLNKTEGKYFNETIHNYNSSDWRKVIEEMANKGMEYLVLMGSGNFEGDEYDGVFYKSDVFPFSPLCKNCEDPLGDLLTYADEFNMKVFVSVGFYHDWTKTLYNMTSDSVFEKSFTAIDEIHAKYGNHKSFYGWYFPDESEIRKYLDEEFISYVNKNTAKVKSLNENYKTLIAPYGTCMLVADDYYTSQLARLDVDFVAYQDEVGVKKADAEHTANYYKALKQAHYKAGKSKLWADVEVFTFEGDVYRSALIPAPLERVESQIKAIENYVDEILIYEYFVMQK